MGSARVADSSPIFGRQARGRVGSAVFRNNPEECHPGKHCGKCEDCIKEGHDLLECRVGNRCGVCSDCYNGYHGAEGTAAANEYAANPEELDEDECSCEPGSVKCDFCFKKYLRDGRAAVEEELRDLQDNPEEDDDEEWDEEEDPHHHNWAEGSYAWRKNPDESEEESDEDEDDAFSTENLSSGLTPPPFEDDEDEDEDEDEDDEDEDDEDDEDEDTSWSAPSAPSLGKTFCADCQDAALLKPGTECPECGASAPAEDTAHRRRRRRRRNPEQSPYDFTGGQEIAEKIFSGGSNTLYRKRLRRRNPNRGNYRRNSSGRGAWGSSLYPKTGGNWGKPLYRRNSSGRAAWGDSLYPETNWDKPLFRNRSRRNPCGSDHKKPRRYRRNAAHSGKTVWGGGLYPSTGKSWDPVWNKPLFRRNKMRRRNPDTGRGVWGDSLYPKVGGNWGKPLYRNRRNPWSDPYAPTKRWTPEMGDYAGEDSIEEELESAANRRFRRRLRRRNPAGRGVWGSSLYGDGPGAWGPTLYRNRRNPCGPDCDCSGCRRKRRRYFHRNP